MIYHGDCLTEMAGFEAESVDAIVTDPPAGIAFMGAVWDKDRGGRDNWIAWMQSVAGECLRVIKPGGHALVWSIPRTSHWTAMAWENAGWQPRDRIAHCFGSGFPKSLDIGKSIDAAEKKRWLDVCKALDNADQSAILEAWKEYSRTASGAGLSFAKNETATGTNTPERGFVPANVALQANPENSDAVALVAELSLTEARRTRGVNCNSAQSPAESGTMESRSLATSAASPSASFAATLDMPDSSALESAWGWQGESTADKLKAVEALKTWLGGNPSTRRADGAALCAALTADLKHITSSQSKTFQNFDTTRQTACASAISATITESTAASLISFTVDTLRSKAIDKAAGAERESLMSYSRAGRVSGIMGKPVEIERHITAPATDAAKQWAGWGTALKPAIEDWWLFRKPVEGTVAGNVVKYGTGGLNIDGCRVAITPDDAAKIQKQVVGFNDTQSIGGNGMYGGGETMDRATYDASTGRFPANIIHDGSDEVVGLFPNAGGGKASGAARFFYQAKASKRDRDEGLENTEAVRRADRIIDDGVGGDNPRNRTNQPRRNHHPTVKPTALMQYLCRLITPPNGLILDPFMGSGSTGKAAIIEGFRFIGIEQDAEYCEIARRRIAHAAASVAGQEVFDFGESK